LLHPGFFIDSLTNRQINKLKKDPLESFFFGARIFGARFVWRSVIWLSYLALTHHHQVVVNKA
ncbi:MAG: hypothetical protein WA901_13375, partial [Phormidesmis sp.]